ncbi:MAG: hypothetical protein ACRCX8_00470 [Sarcina sp.]
MISGDLLPGILNIEISNQTQEDLKDIKIDYSVGCGSRMCMIEKIKPGDSKLETISTKDIFDDRDLRITVDDKEPHIFYENVRNDLSGRIYLDVKEVTGNDGIEFTVTYEDKF